MTIPQGGGKWGNGVLYMALTSVEATELVSKHLGRDDWSCAPFGAGKFSVKGSGTEQYVLRIAPPDHVLQLFYEWDLAIAEYCGVTQPAFWDGYGKTIKTHCGPAAIRRFFYLLYEHQKYIVIAMSSRRNDPNGAKRYAKESLEAVEKFRANGIPAF